jgi:hypothetical protein
MGAFMSPVAGRPAETAVAHYTGMSASDGENWRVHADEVRDVNGDLAVARADRPSATLRRVGWLDQKGRVWTRTPASSGFDGGSLTPLLIDVRED